MAKNGKFNPEGFYGVDRNQAAYWNGAMTRQEAQKVFDEYGSEITQVKKALLGEFDDKGQMAYEGLVQKLFKLDVCIAYLYYKFNITPDELGAWAKSKADKATAEAASADAQHQN